MANQSSSPVVCASFNQDNSFFAIGTRNGFKIFDSNTGRLCYERDMGAFNMVEMLFSSNLLAIVGAGEQPSLSPRRLCLFNTTTGVALRELNFLTSVLAVKINRKRLAVVLQEKTYIYDSNSLAILDTIDTVSNSKGLCAFSPSLDGCFLAVPASTTKDQFCNSYVWDAYLLAIERRLLWTPETSFSTFCQSPSTSVAERRFRETKLSRLIVYLEIEAHRSPLAAIALSSNGAYIATASEQGTIIRVHLVSEATKSYSFRRGTYPSTIFSLSFDPLTPRPNILSATSSSGSVHVFSLAFALNQSKSKRSSSILGSILPESVNDALDPVQHHHLLHNAVPAGVKSYVVIRKVEKTGNTSSAEAICCRATISIITYYGYFQEYKLSMKKQNGSSWSLERNFNLLRVISNNATVSST